MNLINMAIIAGGYILTLLLSGPIFRYFIGEGARHYEQVQSDTRELQRPGFDLGALIGKCENILTITFILAEQYTGLGLIFAAKSIMRSEDIKKNPQYYLGGTYG